MTAGWRECADPVELAAAVAAGVEVQVFNPDSDAWVPVPEANCTLEAFRLGIERIGFKFAVPSSWSWSRESPAPDDLVSRARRHAETHPESRDMIEELLLEVTRWACMVGEASPVPPWPGAVLSGLTDEDGAPTWLAQAGQVPGERVRGSSNLQWVPNHGVYGPTVWVEVRAPRAAAATERVQAWEAVRDGRQVVGASSPFEAHYIWRSGPDRAFIGERTMDKAVLIAPDGTVEVLKDGDR